MKTHTEEAEKKTEEMETFSRVVSLSGIQYESSENFIRFGSRQKAYDELFEALNDSSIHMIALSGESGSGKTALVNELGKNVDQLKMFDKVISITVTRTPDIRAIQGKIADMLNTTLTEESVEGRAKHLWKNLIAKRILIIVDDLWSIFDFKKVGIRLDNVTKQTWKILITTHQNLVCRLMKCQKEIHLELLSDDESWDLFQTFAEIDDQRSEDLKGIPRQICNECLGLPIAIKIVGSLFNGRKEITWRQASEMLRDLKGSVDEDKAIFGVKLSHDQLPTPRAKQIFLLCSLFPEEHHILEEDLIRYVVGLCLIEINSLQYMRNSVNKDLNVILNSYLLIRGSVKMHNMARDAALWIANRSNDCKILVNVDKPLSTVAEDNRIQHCFAVSSWWYNENPSFCELDAPNLKMLLVNINAQSSLNSLDLSPLTFEGIQGLQVFSLTINYKIVPISFPPSIQLLTNVRYLRLNGLKFGDISFIPMLTRLEVLDLRRCEFNKLPIGITNLKSLKLLDLSECHFLEKTYNRAIGKCSQLEEVYASKCYPHKYVNEIIMDICILQNLQRFVLGDPIIPERTRVLHVNDFNISKLTTYKNILQKAEAISLKGLLGGCKNIIPDMVGVVGGMNSLSSLHLTDCEEIECIFDATYDFKEDDLIPRLVELRLKSMYSLTELCYGPPLQVQHYFEKLEVLDIDRCRKLPIIFPSECKLQNLKILRLSYCKTDEVLFSESVAQSMLQLEQLTVKGCNELKHIIASSGEIIPTPMNSSFLMSKLRDIDILSCKSLESIFPIYYVEGLAQLQNMSIAMAPKLEYVFDECDHESLSSHQNQNHVIMPHLEVLELLWLENLVGMCPKNCQAKWPSQSLRIIEIFGCPKLAIPWFNLNAGYYQRQHRLNEIWSFQCLQSLTLFDCKELKCLFSMETHRSLPELMWLGIYNCQELEQIVAVNEEFVQLPNAELYFPKLKQITVENCNNLKTLFPLSLVTMLPQLSILDLSRASQLEEVFRHSQAHGVMNELEIVLPDLTEVRLVNLPNFVDICHGSKLDAFKLQKLSISNCAKTASSLEIIQDQNKEAAYTKELEEVAWDKGKSKETKKVMFDFAGAKHETEEAKNVEELFMLNFKWDIEKTKENKKRRSLPRAK